MKRSNIKWPVLFVIFLLVAQLMVACGEDITATPGYSFQTPTPTVTPPFVAAPNQTPTPNPVATTDNIIPPTATPTPVLPTPIVAPTPTVPREGVITGDDLGISTWGDTEISWANSGDQFLLHVVNQNDPSNFYFLIRPPSSIVASYKLSKGTFATFAWSPSNRYLSYIQLDADGNAGPVKVIDTQGAAYAPMELFRGPCTSVVWGTSGQLLATCGNAIYSLNPDPSQKVQPDLLLKLDEQGRLPGSPLNLSLIARALPSPDGKTLAVFGLQTSVTGKAPSGEIGFLDLQSKKFSVLDRSNRSVAPVDWTPDSKLLVLRNLTGDWAVSYTYDFYLADPAKLKITTNLTKSNAKCDPVLGKADCQGTQPSAYQTSRIVFAPQGNRFFVTGLRYVPRPNVGLQTAERILSGTITDGKPAQVNQVVEQPAGGKIVGLVWLPGNHYFYSYVSDSGGTKAFLDNKPITVTATQPRTSTTPSSTTKATGEFNGGAVVAFGLAEEPPTPTTPGTTAASSPATTGSTTATTQTPDTGIQPVKSPSPDVSTVTGTPGTVSASPSVSLVPSSPAPTLDFPTPIPIPTVKPEPTPTTAPKSSKDRPVTYGYYISPTANWIISVEKISDDKPVQYQLRLIPYSLK